jgi:thiol-disulfide isomerase/thioredoxin
VEPVRRSSAYAVTVALLVFAALPAATRAAAAPSKEPASALDQHGRAHAWQGATGELTLLEFSASWCAPCRWTLPRLQALALQHPDLRVLAVSVDERRQGRDQLVKALSLTLPMLWDEGHRIAEHYAPQAMPATLLISPAGQVLHTALGSGLDDWELLVHRVEEELKRGRVKAAP